MAALTVSRRYARMLGATVAIEGVVALVLGVFDVFDYPDDLATRIGSVIWLATAAVNLVAAERIFRRRSSWLAPTVVGQVFVLILAGYVVVVDAKSPYMTWRVTGPAVAAGVIALLWLARLLPGIPHSFSKGWVALAALFPLLGIFQWWLQTDYMPRTDRPRVDMTAQLVEVNRSGPIVHLRARVTLHNLGSTRVDSVGSLLRVTGYPPDGAPAQPSTAAVSSGIDWIGADGHDYRANPVDRAGRTLLYSGVFFPTGGTFLPPGVSIATAPVIDVDSRVVGRVQLSATIAFVTARRLGSVHTCIPPRVDSADTRFVKTSRRPFGSSASGHYLCVESDLKPRNVVQSMVDDDPTIRSYIVLDDPAQAKSTEFPEFLFTFGTHVSFEGDAQRAQEVSDSIDANNPSEYLEVDDEYVLGDHASSGGG